MPPLDDDRVSHELRERLTALGDDVPRRFADIARTVSLPAGSTIIFEGDFAKEIFALSAGIARVLRLLADGRRQITGFLYAGDFLGVNSSETYAFGAEAATEVTLLAFRRRDVERLTEEMPEIGRMFLLDAFSELAAAQDRMLLLGRKSGTERIASFLLMLSLRQPAETSEPVREIEIPVSLIDVADYLGLRPETISRYLSWLRREGIIRTGRSWREIEIVRWEKLVNLSGGDSE
jgi:CRP/FNR family transcriptional regulator